ncbi:MAG: TIGR02300 family protein [Alphaproteobacteria bacterium]|nr:MAG: TIGR02300 family protein [Alphaproteobacteria bacterium]
MAKPEWGTKRTCPECGTRFYDLGRNDPAACIDCGHEWVPEPVLKSKQIIVEQAPAAKAETDEADDVVDVEVDVDVDDEAVDDDIDIDDDADVPVPKITKEDD